MLFAGVPLAKRIENAETRLMMAVTEPCRGQPGFEDVLLAPLAGGVAAYSGAGSPMNKIAGLGFDGPVDEDALAAIEREFDRRGAAVQVELASLAETSIGALLTRRGYVLAGYEDVLGMRLDVHSLSSSTDNSEIVITEATDEETPVWFDTVITGFLHPDVVEGLTPHESYDREMLERFFGVFERAVGFRRFFARRGGAIAGGASIRLDTGVAQLCGAATLPEHRRRGVQSALLRARLRDAARQGCDIAVMTTQPGSKSQENGMRQGFSILYTRAILQREPRL